MTTQRVARCRELLRQLAAWTKLGRTVLYERQSVLDWMKRNQLNLQREQPPIRRRRRSS